MKSAKTIKVWACAFGLILMTGRLAQGQGLAGANGVGQIYVGQIYVAQIEVSPEAPPIPTLGPGSVPPEVAAQQAKLLNESRQKQLVSDTQKLVALANELKAEVDKSNKDTLSLDVVRKAEEIEKLAHSVKEKMKGS